MGGTKGILSPASQNVGGTCPPVPPETGPMVLGLLHQGFIYHMGMPYGFQSFRVYTRYIASLNYTILHNDLQFTRFPFRQYLHHNLDSSKIRFSLKPLFHETANWAKTESLIYFNYICFHQSN